MEQLKTHCNRLDVPLFDRGYDKDPTNVAAEAIKQAARDGIDVVLVDTAGRMQDNEPLMHALSMLINKNNPDVVLFVGEALVGNEGAPSAHFESNGQCLSATSLAHCVHARQVVWFKCLRAACVMLLSVLLASVRQVNSTRLCLFMCQNCIRPAL